MAEDTPPAGQAGFLRPALITISCLLAAILLVAVTVWVFRLSLAERVAIALLDAKGIESAELTIESLTTSSATVSNIRLGPEQVHQVGRIEATYALDGLLNGEIQRLRIQNVKIQGQISDDGVSLPGLDALFTGDSDGPPPLRIATMEIEDIRADIATPHGDASATGRATVRTTADGLTDVSGSFTIGLQGPDIDALGDTDITATLLPDGEILARAVLSKGRLEAGTASIPDLQGIAQLVSTGPDMAADMTMEARQVFAAGHSLHAAALSLGLNIGTAGTTIDARLDAREGHVALQGDLIEESGNGYRYDGGVALALALPDIQARLESELRAAAIPGSALSANLTINDAAFAFRDIAVNDVTGTAGIRQSGSDIPEINASIAFRRLRAPGLDTASGTLAVRHDAAATEAHGTVTAADSEVGFEATLKPDRPLAFSAQGQIAPARILEAVDTAFRTDGDLAFDLSGTLRDPLKFANGIPDRLTLTGSVTPMLEALRLPGVLDSGTLKGRVDIAAQPGHWTFTIPSLRLANARIAPEVLSPVPADLRQHANSPVTAELGAPNQPPAMLRITPQGDGYAATLAGISRISTGSIDLAVSGQADAMLDSDGTAARVTKSTGKFRLKAAHTHPISERFVPVTFRPDLTGTFALEDQKLSVRIAPASGIEIGEMDAPDLFRTAEPLQLTFSQPTLLHADLNRTPAELQFEGGVILKQSRITIAAEADPINLNLSDIPVRFAGRPENMTIAVAPSQIDIPHFAFHAGDISLDIGISDILTLAAEIGDIRHTSKAPAVIPLQLKATARLESNQAGFSAHLHDPSETISVKAEGQHDLAAGAGAASIQTARITFLPTVLQPVQLFPIIGKQIQDADGYIEGKAALAWQGDNIDSSAEILADITALKTEEVQLENAATVVTFDSLFPLSTPPGQEIHVGKLDIGVPLTSGRIEFQLNREGHITAALRELDLFGGGIETETFTIPAQLDGFTIPLQVNGVRLDSLLAATKVGDLTATGTLNGQIPVKFEGGGVFLRNGVLESAPGGGSIQYRPEAVGPALSEANEGTALFLDIVRDFKYESVRVTIDEQASGDIPFEFAIKGSNPTVYNGIPVELNLSMSGPLRAILQQGLKTYTLPDRLLERMQDFADQ